MYKSVSNVAVIYPRHVQMVECLQQNLSTSDHWQCKTNVCIQYTHVGRQSCITYRHEGIHVNLTKQFLTTFHLAV